MNHTASVDTMSLHRPRINSEASAAKEDMLTYKNSKDHVQYRSCYFPINSLTHEVNILGRPTVPMLNSKTIKSNLIKFGTQSYSVSHSSLILVYTGQIQTPI